MDMRFLGRSGLQVSVLSFGTMTFGGRGRFEAMGSTGVQAARRQLDARLDGCGLLTAQLALPTGDGRGVPR